MAEDFNKLKLIAHHLAQMEFREKRMFRVEIKSDTVSIPEDFDYFVKDLTYDPIGYDTDTENIAGHTFTWPKSEQPVTFTMTMRDHKDERIRKWFAGLTENIVNTDGTVNLASKSKLTLTKYNIDAGGTETHTGEWTVIATKMSEISESREDPGHVEFQVTFVQYKTTS